MVSSQHSYTHLSRFPACQEPRLERRKNDARNRVQIYQDDFKLQKKRPWDDLQNHQRPSGNLESATKKSKAFILDELLLSVPKQVHFHGTPESRRNLLKGKENIRDVSRVPAEKKACQSSSHKPASESSILQLAKKCGLNSPSKLKEVCSVPPRKPGGKLDRLAECKQQQQPLAASLTQLASAFVGPSTGCIGSGQRSSGPQPFKGKFQASSLSNQLPIAPKGSKSSFSHVPPSQPPEPETSVPERPVQVSPCQNKSRELGPLASRAKMLGDLDKTRLRMWRSDLEAQVATSQATKSFEIVSVKIDQGLQIAECCEIPGGQKYYVGLCGERIREGVQVRLYWPWHQMGESLIISDRYIVT